MIKFLADNYFNENRKVCKITELSLWLNFKLTIEILCCLLAAQGGKTQHAVECNCEVS